MSITRADLTVKARGYAQDSGPSSPLLFNDGDYDLAIDAALPTLDGDRPNVRIVHHAVSSTTTRLILAGSGVIAGMAGVDAWVDGASALRGVAWPFDTASPYAYPLAASDWYVQREPSGLIALELLSGVSSGTVRLEFVKPHTVHDTDATLTSVRAGDVNAFAVLVAAEILQMAANRAAQNTGTSSLPSDIVDRRSQGDIYASRARELRTRYAALIASSGAVFGYQPAQMFNIPLVRA